MTTTLKPTLGQGHLGAFRAFIAMGFVESTDDEDAYVSVSKRLPQGNLCVSFTGDGVLSSYKVEVWPDATGCAVLCFHGTIKAAIHTAADILNCSR